MIEKKKTWRRERKTVDGYSLTEWLIDSNVNFMLTSSVNKEKHANINFYLLQKTRVIFLERLNNVMI